jgi:hypothetical protein
MCLKISSVVKHLCNISANETEMVLDPDSGGKFAADISSLLDTLL